MTPHEHRIEILIPGEPVAQPRAKAKVEESLEEERS